MSISVKIIKPIEISTALLVLIKKYADTQRTHAFNYLLWDKVLFQNSDLCKSENAPKMSRLCGRLEMGWLEPAIAWLGRSRTQSLYWSLWITFPPASSCMASARRVCCSTPEPQQLWRHMARAKWTWFLLWRLNFFSLRASSRNLVNEIAPSYGYLHLKQKNSRIFRIFSSIHSKVK